MDAAMGYGAVRADNPVAGADGKGGSSQSAVAVAKGDLEAAFQLTFNARRTSEGSATPEVSAAEMVGMMEQLMLASWTKAEAVKNQQTVDRSSFLAAFAQASETPTNW